MGRSRLTGETLRVSDATTSQTALDSAVWEPCTGGECAAGAGRCPGARGGIFYPFYHTVTPHSQGPGQPRAPPLRAAAVQWRSPRRRGRDDAMGGRFKMLFETGFSRFYRLLRNRFDVKPQEKTPPAGCGRRRGVAERVGFEPTVPRRVLQISSLTRSTTLPPLRGDSKSAIIADRRAEFDGHFRGARCPAPWRARPGERVPPGPARPARCGPASPRGR